MLSSIRSYLQPSKSSQAAAEAQAEPPSPDRSRPNCSIKCIAIGRRPITSPSGKFTCRKIRYCASPSRRAHQAAPARTLGHFPGLELHLRAPESPDQREGRQCALHRRARARRARAEREFLSRRHLYRRASRDHAGCRGHAALFREFSTPGGVPSHCGPHLPNSIHEGGELGYALLHAFGAAFDNPDLLVACVIGDGEAETCPLEGSWKSNRFLNPGRDGAVLPILHLNGYKISGPTVEARTARRRTRPSSIAATDTSRISSKATIPPSMHQKFAAALDTCYAEIRAIQAERARKRRPRVKVPTWPMIVLRSPKGWTGPKEVDGVPIEGTFRAHQVPLATVRENPRASEAARSVDEELSPGEALRCRGKFDPELQAIAPQAALRMGANPACQRRPRAERACRFPIS